MTRQARYPDPPQAPFPGKKEGHRRFKVNPGSERSYSMLKKLNHGMEYIEAHLEDIASLEEIAAHVRVSDCHFRRIFFALTNMTLGEYVKNRRLSEANRELLQPE